MLAAAVMGAVAEKLASCAKCAITAVTTSKMPASARQKNDGAAFDSGIDHYEVTPPTCRHLNCDATAKPASR